jgi:O-antigen/teichoic acid export membrane protein
MSKVDDIAQVSAKGSFNMLWGLVVSTLISAFGTIFIARLMGSDLYGLYTVVLTVPALFQIFRDWGISFAMIKFSAQYRAEGRLDEIRSIFFTGMLFEVVVGLILVVFSFLFADFLATSVFNRPAIAPLIKIVSLSIFAAGLITAATSVFTGYERLELNSILLICQSIIKTVLIVTLVIFGLGAAGATIGFTVGTSAAGIIGIVLIGVIYRKLPKPTSHRREIKAYLTNMLSYCLPLSVATIIGGLLPQFYAFLLPIHYVIDNVPIGNYGVAINFVVLISFFATPITTMMFPAFSKLDASRDREALRSVFRFSVKYASLLVVPITVLVMCLSGPAVQTLFGNSYDSAALFLALLAIQFLPVLLGTLSIGPLINGQGQTRFTMKVTILTGCVGFPLGYFLIMNFGVLGLIATLLTSGWPAFIWQLHFVKQNYDVSVDWGSSARILLASAVAGVSTYAVVSLMAFASWVELLLGVIVFAVIVVPALLFSRSIGRSDVQNLKSMVGQLGFIGALFRKILDFLFRVMIFLKL